MTQIMPAPTHDSPAAQAGRRAHPGAGWCGRCGYPWPLVAEHHTTWYGNGRRGLFPLCSPCWSLLGHPEARIGYYAALLDAWASAGYPVSDTDRQLIGRAVANER